METTLARTADRLVRAASRAAEAVAHGDEKALSADGLLSLLKDASEVRDAADLLVASLSAEVARRSQRDAGYGGLAQQMGHRTATSLVQNITGQSRAEVGRALRTGEDLAALDLVAESGAPHAGRTDAAGVDAGADTPARGPDAAGATPAAVSWHALLGDALVAGAITSAQYSAIRVGLGEPPVERYPELEPDFLPRAWTDAVEILLDEASGLPVEELRAAARTARDRLDPVGVTLRFEERFAARSFRAWIDENGQHHAKIVFDDDAAAWVHTILRSALRPRRGPRFVGEGAAERRAEAAADDRTNEQLQYDTLLAVLRTGAAADPDGAFGDRQPGVRILVEADALDNPGERGRAKVAGVGHLEDGGTALPGGVVESYLCDAGDLTITADATGRPLDVGRKHRLFTRVQRIAIAARHGGCMGEYCTAPISHCEFHHIDHWWEHHGRTDVDDGVPLCRNCHLRLHNQGARITRRRDPDSGEDTYFLLGPPDPVTGLQPEPRRLRTKSPRRFPPPCDRVGAVADAILDVRADARHTRVGRPRRGRSSDSATTCGAVASARSPAVASARSAAAASSHATSAAARARSAARRIAAGTSSAAGRSASSRARRASAAARSVAMRPATSTPGRVAASATLKACSSRPADASGSANQRRASSRPSAVIPQ